MFWHLPKEPATHSKPYTLFFAFNPNADASLYESDRNEVFDRFKFYMSRPWIISDRRLVLMDDPSDATNQEETESKLLKMVQVPSRLQPNPSYPPSVDAKKRLEDLDLSPGDHRRLASYRESMSFPIPRGAFRLRRIAVKDIVQDKKSKLQGDLLDWLTDVFDVVKQERLSKAASEKERMMRRPASLKPAETEHDINAIAEASAKDQLEVKYIYCLQFMLPNSLLRLVYRRFRIILRENAGQNAKGGVFAQSARIMIGKPESPHKYIMELIDNTYDETYAVKNAFEKSSNMFQTAYEQARRYTV